MVVGDVVKLMINPSVDWMNKYLEETFEVLSFPTKTGVKLKMVGSDPEWVWIAGKNNFEIVSVVTEDTSE